MKRDQGRGGKIKVTNKVLRWIIVCLLPLLLFGCGKREINELAMVTAVGFDKGKKPGTIQITAQIVRPADARGQTGAPSGATGEPIYSATAEGESIFAAMRNLARFTTRRVFWAQNFIIVISEDVAKKGVRDILDFFTRNHETRMNTWIVATPNKAADLVSTVTGLEVVPGEAVDKLFRYNEIVAEAPRTNVMRFEESFLSRSTHPVLAKMQLRKRGISNKKPEQFGSIEQIELSGSAIFRRDKLVGWLSPIQSRGLLFFIEKVDSAVEPLPCPGAPKNSTKKVSLELKHQKFQVKPFIRNGKPEFSVKLTTYADLVESSCTIPFENIKKTLENELKKELQTELKGVIHQAQNKYKIDFLKLGEVFENRYPVEWKKMQKNWDQEFSGAKINVSVQAHVNSPVLLKRPTVSEKGGNK
jgi:spore germination protein KC